MNEKPPPAPKKGAICWDFYFSLAPGFNIKDGREINQKKVSKKDIKTAQRALTWNELDQYIFLSCSEAALALTRAIALLDSTDRNPESMVIVKAYLLMGRAALYLAREAHYKYNINQAPTGYDELVKRHTNASLAKAMQACIFMAAEDPVNTSLAMSRFAWITVGQVANDQARTGRPGMAEAWLVSAQVELLQAEVEASRGQDKATKVRPKDRIGPYSQREGITEEELQQLGPDRLEGWKVNIPGQQQDASQDKAKLYLADYWFGQSEQTAIRILCTFCTNALKNLERYKSLATDTVREAWWSKENAMERDLFRMGAAALMSLDNAIDQSNMQKQEFVEALRHIFPGTPFQPTESFCRELKTGHPDDPGHKQWNITCQLGSFGVKNRTMLTIMDTSLNTPWSDMIVGSKMLYGEGDEYNYPTPRQLYELLLEAMAGAGSEMRCSSGPPRRPRVVVMSHRLRYSFGEVKRLLSRVNVDCIIETEESLRFACANNQTDFETGCIQEMEQTLVGQQVGICELRNRKELNGRVGRVLKFHEDQERKEQGRWEVKLERFAPGEKTLTIAVKPKNVIGCPPQFVNTSEYLMYRDEIRSWSVDESIEKTDDAAVKALLDKLRGQGEISDDCICAICQESATEMATTSNALLPCSSGALLPCGHAFHLDCVLPWIHREKVECPVCREKF